MKLSAMIALVTTFCSACAGPAKQSELVLPFHVAVVPVELAMPVEAPADAAASESKRLAVEPAALSRKLAEKLGATCFTRVTLLSPPDVPLDEFALRPRAERDQYWISAAASAGADLIATGELRVGVVTGGAINEKFWLNLPLFICGGPACYFVDDRTYRADARLDVWLSDLLPLTGAQTSLTEGGAELAHVQSRFQGATLDFWDRAGGDAGSLATSILIPAGLLAKSGLRVERAVADKAIEELVAGVRSELQSKAMDVLVAKRVSDFYVDPTSTLVSNGDSLRLQGAVILRRGEIERIDSWRLQAGAYSLEGEFSEATLDGDLTAGQDRYMRYPIDIGLPGSNDCGEATLTIVSAGRDPMARTFTFAVTAARR